MDIERIRNFCLSLPFVTEEVKWGHDLCFMIGGKMFCVTGFDKPLKVSLKVPDEEFEHMSNLPGITPAPYVARYKWVLIGEPDIFNDRQWEYYLAQSYNLVKEKLPKHVLKELR